jgi:hypothetical protein
MRYYIAEICRSVSIIKCIKRNGHKISLQQIYIQFARDTQDAIVLCAIDETFTISIYIIVLIETVLFPLGKPLNLKRNMKLIQYKILFNNYITYYQNAQFL